MSRTHLLLVIAFFAIPVLPIEGVGQVNLRRYPVQRGDGETLEMDRTEAYQSGQRQRRGIEQQRGMDRLQDQRERELEYAADACGLGCEDHEGLQVHRIPGTHLAAVVYKALLDDDVLTVQLRFHNDGAERARLTMNPSGAPESFFVQVGEDHLPILTDDDGELQSKGAVDEVLQPGEIESWWARFPAPSSDATTFDLHIPAGTFRDVPLVD